MGSTIATSGTLKVRRQNGIASVIVTNLALAAGVSGTVDLPSFPSGFRPGVDANGAAIASSGAHTPIRFLAAHGGQLRMWGVPANAVINASFSFPTDDAWPVSLPS